jgi:hypothetical protein
VAKAISQTGSETMAGMAASDEAALAALTKA